MTEPDIKSTLVAAGLGAGLFLILDYAGLLRSKNDPVSDIWEGALVGAAIQLGVRVMGVS